MKTTLSEYYIDCLIRAIRQGGFDVPNGITFGESAKRTIRPLYNRIIKSHAAKIVAEDGVFALMDFAEHIANGEILATPETLLWYVFDKYGSRDYDHSQVTLERMCAADDVIRIHAEEIICWLLGLSIKYPELLTFSPTHGLNVLTLKTRKETTNA